MYKIYIWWAIWIKLCGLSYVCNNQFYNGTKIFLLNKVEYTLQSQFIQSWSVEIYNQNKCLNYRMYKTDHYPNILDGKLLQPFVNFRMCRNQVPFEMGRWFGTEISDRKCNLWNLNEIADEFHFFYLSVYFAVKNEQLSCWNNNIEIQMFMLKNIMNSNNNRKLVILNERITNILKHVNLHVKLLLYYGKY